MAVREVLFIGQVQANALKFLRLGCLPDLLPAGMFPLMPEEC
jgi:hypothetical protein